MADFEKVALLTMRNGRFLMCRKDHFTSKLILPGGRIEPGETALDCLQREIREELGDIDVVSPRHIGTYEDMAHADDPAIRKTLRIELYEGSLNAEPRPCNEIVALSWFGPESDTDELTPIFVNQILPDLRKMGILPW